METLWTGLANSPKPSQQTQHIQKAWDGPVAANQKNLILSRAPSDVDKARLLAAASAHSGDWLHAPSITAVGLRLSDEAVRVAVAQSSGVLGGIRGYTPYTNLRVFLTAYTHLSDHK